MNVLSLVFAISGSDGQGGRVGVDGQGGGVGACGREGGWALPAHPHTRPPSLPIHTHGCVCMGREGGCVCMGREGRDVCMGREGGGV